MGGERARIEGAGQDWSERRQGGGTGLKSRSQIGQQREGRGKGIVRKEWTLIGRENPRGTNRIERSFSHWSVMRWGGERVGLKDPDWPEWDGAGEEPLYAESSGPLPGSLLSWPRAPRALPVQGVFHCPVLAPGRWHRAGLSPGQPGGCRGRQPPLGGAVSQPCPPRWPFLLASGPSASLAPPPLAPSSPPLAVSPFSLSPCPLLPLPTLLPALCPLPAPRLPSCHSLLQPQPPLSPSAPPSAPPPPGLSLPLLFLPPFLLLLFLSRPSSLSPPSLSDPPFPPSFPLSPPRSCSLRSSPSPVSRFVPALSPSLPSPLAASAPPG